MVKLDFLDSLITNNTIVIGALANDWKQAVHVAIQPLITAGVCTNEYDDAIIASVNEHGPYFIISENVAMPHAGSDRGVLKNGFSLVTLAHPVKFDGDDRKVSLLVALAANSPDIHVGVALPQIAALVEDPQVVDQLIHAPSTQAVIKIIQTVDLTKYLPNPKESHHD